MFQPQPKVKLTPDEIATQNERRERLYRGNMIDSITRRTSLPTPEALRTMTTPNLITEYDRWTL